MMRSTLFAAVFLVGIVLASSVFAYDNGVVPVNTPESAKRMIDDLIKTFGEKYPKGKEYLDTLARIDPKDQNALDILIKEASLANPLLDFDKIALVQRNGFAFASLNSHTTDTVRRHGWNNSIIILSNLRAETPTITPIFDTKDDKGKVIRDLNVHFDGKRIVFSSINKFDRWAIFEIDSDGKNLKELTPDNQKDVDWFDATYLPEEGQIITASTAGMQGLPCENGGKAMVNLYRVDTNTKKVRQLTFEQDSDWHPTVMHDGRVMYLRWEYSDIPHYMSRILFSMQPDGRQQRAIWGSGSMFPTAYKNPRPIPGHSSMVIGVVSGHHIQGGGIPETGRLVLINPQLGSKYPMRYDPTSKEWAKPLTHFDMYPRIYPKEETGCVQEIPGWGREVVGNIYDNQGGRGTYRFVYPYPLSENYYLVSMKLNKGKQFGLYLVDRFDNMTKILELPNDSVFHPIPLQPQSRPIVREDMTDPAQKQGSMFITDVYAGPGLKGVPRGTAKSLRIFAYHYGYRNSGGHESVGLVSSWDIKRILGTVPIEDDGSASFNIPANTPVSIQVLDKDGRAIQLMRSWTVCMPGEQQSCVGCHETPLEATPSKTVKAATIKPHDITPFYGEARPFGYQTEIQPLLDAKCVKCHNDEIKKGGKMLSFEAHNTGNWRSDTSYAAFNPFFWRPGPESDPDLLVPLDYHASVSEFVQRFEKGEHYGVKLEKADWDRINIWVDLNIPYRGQWHNPGMEKRRLELQQLYAGIGTNPESEFRSALDRTKKNEEKKLSPEELSNIIKKYKTADDLKAAHFPFDADTAKKMQSSAAIATLTIPLPPAPQPKAKYLPPFIPSEQQSGQLPKVDLGTGKKIVFVRIPAGEYVAGQLDSFMPDEKKRKIVKIEKPFWIAETEITNAQYAAFNPDHDTRYLREDGKDHTVPGYIANHPDQPVARISYQEAETYCQWLTEQLKQQRPTSHAYSALPTEGQWEWAARAGSATPFWYGDRNADFSKFANLSGKETEETYTTWESGSTIHKRRSYGENSLFPLRDNRFADKWFVADYVKQYEPSPWGLYDVIGNVWEWTKPDTDRTPAGKVTAHGGSWKDRPKVAGAAARVVYEPWQKVMNVGFRPIIVEQ